MAQIPKNMKHTPEPWVTHPRNEADIHSLKGDWLVASMAYGLPNNATKANAARIVACVNACAGMEFPELNIQQLNTGNALLERERIF